MKKIAIALLMIFIGSMVASCAGSSKSRSSYSGCNAQKRNNHKASRTFLY